MERLWLDYQCSDPQRGRPGLVLLAFGIAFALLSVVNYFAVAAERDDAQAQVEAARRDTAGLSTAAASRPGANGKTAEAAAEPPSAQRWESLFSSLESAADDTVTLLTLHPGEKEIQLSGEAKNFASAVDYVQRLESSAALANVRLTQSEVLAQHPQQPVRFALVADWQGMR